MCMFGAATTPILKNYYANLFVADLEFLYFSNPIASLADVILLAVSLALSLRFILRVGSIDICKFGTSDYHSLLYVEDFPVGFSSSLAVGANGHTDLSSADRAVVTAVARTNLAAHNLSSL